MAALEQRVRDEIRALLDKETDPKRLVEITEPELEAASGKFLERYKGKKPVKGSDFEKTFNDIAVDYLKAMKLIGGDEKDLKDPVYLRRAGGILRQIVGEEGYAQIRTLAGHGDYTRIMETLNNAGRRFMTESTYLPQLFAEIEGKDRGGRIEYAKEFAKEHNLDPNAFAELAAQPARMYNVMAGLKSQVERYKKQNSV